jgi:hypothetical protein
VTAKICSGVQSDIGRSQCSHRRAVTLRAPPVHRATSRQCAGLCRGPFAEAGAGDNDATGKESLGSNGGDRGRSQILKSHSSLNGESILGEIARLDVCLHGVECKLTAHVIPRQRSTPGISSSCGAQGCPMLIAFPEALTT